MSSFEDDNGVRRREGKYRKFLNSLQKCNTFEELKLMCANIDGQIDDVNGSERRSRCYSVDYMSETYVPRSLSQRGDAPIKVRADGNCLPVCGSIFVFGNDRHQHKSEQELLLKRIWWNLWKIQHTHHRICHVF
jgi:hypothetical protein